MGSEGLAQHYALCFALSSEILINDQCPVMVYAMCWMYLFSVCLWNTLCSPSHSIVVIIIVVSFCKF